MKNNLKKETPLPKKSKPAPQQKKSSLNVDHLFWQAELAELKGRTFRTETEVSDIIIDRVLEKYGVSSEEKDETREFLLLLLDTDEGFQDEIRKFIVA